MHKTLIKNAQILDGTGRAPFAGGVLLANGRIEAVGALPDDAADELVDAGGRTLTPGFIDAHGHADLFTGYDRLLANKLEQGITTELCGQCGLGPAPVAASHLAEYTAYYQKLGAPVHPGASDFTTFGAYLRAADAAPTGVNLACFVPHGTLRIAAMGLSPARPDGTQLQTMQTLLGEAMEAGALGLSTGLMYAPGSYADADELAALTAIVGRYGGVYTSHIRNQAEGLLDSVRETIETARRGGARANISHHKASGTKNWGRVRESTALIHGAPIPCTHDVYPYTAASTTIWGTVPPKYQRLGQEGFLSFLRTAGGPDALRRALFEPDEEFDNAVGSSGFDNILVLNAAKTPDAEGKTIAAYARQTGTEPFDAYIRLILDNELGVTYAGFEMCEEDVRFLLTDPLCMFGTDGLYMAGMTMTHPRAFGTFPRILGRYVRTERLLPLAEAVRRMTSLPADTYRLPGKGRIAAGCDADLVLFDPETILDGATYADPTGANIGIDKVYVGGVCAVDGGRATGAKNGRIVRPAHE